MKILTGRAAIEAAIELEHQQKLEMRRDDYKRRKETLMPKVGGKHYPYTKAGYKAAAKARKSMPKPMKKAARGR